MTFRQLEALVAIVRCGSFGAAADSLGVSQVSITKHVKALEQAYGTTLFERVRGKPGLLTQPGEELASFAETVLSGLDRIRRGRAAASQRTRVEIAASEAAIDRSFMPALARFYLKHPNIEVHFRPVPSALTSIQQLDPEQVDFAFLALPESPEYVSGQHLGEIPCALYASPELAQRISQGLRPVPVIWPPKGGAVARIIESALVAADLAPFEPVQRVQRLASGLDLAVLGLGVCCLSRIQAEASVDASRLQSIGTVRGVNSYVIPINANQSEAAQLAREFFSSILVRDTIIGPTGANEGQPGDPIAP